MEAELVIAWGLSYTELACVGELERCVMKSLHFTVLTAGGSLSPPGVEVYRVSALSISHTDAALQTRLRLTSRRAKAKEAASPLWFIRDRS
mgnify:CR=1 FL=1